MEYRIMIVEDDPGIAGAIADCMVQWGLKAEAVSDFRRVMEDFARIQPHLVLLDITLPFMNGYHWCAEIRKVSSVPASVHERVSLVCGDTQSFLGAGDLHFLRV